MNISEVPCTGVLVVEPMGNAGQFLVAAAERMGLSLYAATHRTVHASYPPGLARALAGVCFTDLTDPARAVDDMEAFCREHGIGAVAACWELLTPLAAELAARLGVPGNDPLRARAARNKIAMAQAFRAAGVPAPRGRVAADAEEAWRLAGAGQLGWPLVVKPAEQGGSWGVSVVGGPGELAAAVAAATRYTVATPHGLPLDSRVLLQSYVPGEEYSAETVVCDGVAYALPVVRKDTTHGRYRVETGHSCPAGLSPELTLAVQHTAARAALAVGVRNGIAHTELKVPPGTGRPVVIETGARLPGDNICEVVEAATGLREAEAYLMAVTGRPPQVVATRDGAAAIRFLLPGHAGVLEGVFVPEVPGTHSEIHLRPGDTVPEPSDSSGRVGHVVARAASPAEARRLADLAASGTRLKVNRPVTEQIQKLAFLRSVAIQRADPYVQQAVRALAEQGVESMLFHTHGEAGDEDFPGGRRRVDADVTPAELAALVADWGATAAVSISLPCENAVRDAAVKELLDAQGIPTVVSPLGATLALVDKWETKQLLLRAGLDVPRGFRADSDLLAGRGLGVPAYPAAVRAEARRIGYPLLSKPIWDSTSMGIRALPDPAALDAYLADPPPVSAVVEECVSGDLCSVDVVGGPGGYRVLPLCWTGKAGTEPAFTFADLRWCGPRPEADAAFEPVARKLVALCEELGVLGSVNVDMIYTGSRYVVLEVNPRIGGATTLSCAASGTNTFAALADLALGRTAPAAAAGRTLWAIEFLSPERLPDAARTELRERLDVVTAHELVIDDTGHGDIVVLTLAEGEEQPTVKALTELHAAHGFPREEILAKIRNLLTP
ncbi:Alanine--anticapsin ligase [Streptomyces xanthophaeus]|uniref:ATP-grasp domain-containing protein n=1 Tax=Streptomyces xanthophaeus TaxID=67385 RepID=UPI00233EF812|nr:ATP-grasp domain-containing protein [Streptomyces xanthophaeus]WCD90086.1 Alanine--anticapsin ligase [Streptomyces xanthophaeus]